MKKTMLSACFVLFAGNALAADGTIHFTGSISDQTCTVDSNSQDLTVDLGKVAQSALNGSKGKRVAPTQFTIKVASCPATVTGASIKFDGNANSDDTTLLALDGDTGVATGVGIQIADKTGTVIPLHNASPNYTLVSGDNSFDFVARYVASKDEVGTGTANATSEFTIVYK
ncbi:fimbrial protein [Citrobacter portucalensis]|uniref:fimbrial protein n=1 Tax=Citrobacter portucalensis TaxID=1639133 RepID=UPI003BF57E43